MGAGHLPVTLLPTTLNVTQRYVACPNKGMGAMKVGKGRAVYRCKIGCKYFRAMVGTDLACAWVKGQSARVY